MPLKNVPESESPGCAGPLPQMFFTRLEQSVCSEPSTGLVEEAPGERRSASRTFLVERRCLGPLGTLGLQFDVTAHEAQND